MTVSKRSNKWRDQSKWYILQTWHEESSLAGYRFKNPQVRIRGHIIGKKNMIDLSDFSRWFLSSHNLCEKG